MLFEFVHKVLLPHNVSSTIDFFLMKTLSKFVMINLLSLILEYMRKVVHVKDSKTKLPYWYFITKAFKNFKIKCVGGV